jgi:Ca2+-binding RTX toxin-like protein
VGSGGKNGHSLQSVDVLPDGRFLVAWTEWGRDPRTSAPEIKARLFDANGVPLGGEVFISVASMNGRPVVTSMTDGTFLVFWDDRSFSSSYKAQKIDSDGTKIGTPFNVAPTLDNFAPTLEIAALSGGRYVAVWQDAGLHTRLVQVRLFQGDGTPMAPVLTAANVDWALPGLEVQDLEGGGFVVVWQERVQTRASEWLDVVRAQMFDAGGVKVGGVIDVNPGAGEAYSLDVAPLSDGGFVVSWEGDFRSLYAQFVQANGTKSGSPVRIDSDSWFESFHSVEVLDNGRIAFSWTNEGATFFRVRVSEADGTWIGQEFFIPAGFSLDAKLAAMSGGRFVVTWTDSLTQTAHAQVFSAELRSWSLLGTSEDDYLEGDRLNDALSGSSGDDELWGLGGNDDLDGGDGSDTVSYAEKTSDVFLVLGGSHWTVVTVGGTNEDRIRNVENAIGGAGNDFFFGDALANIFLGDAGADVLLGQGGDDWLVGGRGHDYLYGGDGNDIMIGGNSDTDFLEETGNNVFFGEGGNDSMWGGAGADYFDGGAGDDYAFGGDGEYLVLRGNDIFLMGDGNDLAIGQDGNDYFDLGNGNDEADGGTGDDIFLGGAGDDYMVGGLGHDYFDAGVGDDFIDGGEGNDIFLGGAGNDFFVGGSGLDVALGGAGNDTYYVDPNSGVLVIYDFVAGGVNDSVYLPALTFIQNFAQARAALSFNSTYYATVLTIDSDTSVWLMGVAPGQLTNQDFLFV